MSRGPDRIELDAVHGVTTASLEADRPIDASGVSNPEVTQGRGVPASGP